eukprot:SAG11_NODE_3664_length_2300_cov_19.540209_1_plen_312_part_00
MRSKSLVVALLLPATIQSQSHEPEPCEDLDGMCSSWAVEGQCDDNPGFMHASCRRACNLCEDPYDGDYARLYNKDASSCTTVNAETCWENITVTGCNEIGGLDQRLPSMIPRPPSAEPSYHGVMDFFSVTCEWHVERCFAPDHSAECARLMPPHFVFAVHLWMDCSPNNNFEGMCSVREFGMAGQEDWQCTHMFWDGGPDNNPSHFEPQADGSSQRQEGIYVRIHPVCKQSRECRNNTLSPPGQYGYPAARDGSGECCVLRNINEVPDVFRDSCSEAWERSLSSATQGVAAPWAFVVVTMVTLVCVVSGVS